MTTHHKYNDGRPQKKKAAYEQLCKLALQRKVVCMYLMLIACFIFAATFFSDSITLSAVNQQQKLRPGMSPFQESPPASTASHATEPDDSSDGSCDIWRGDWIPHPGGPAYTNESCAFIQEKQNCMKLGRPDLGFLNWRWKPHDCELPLFDARAFLKVVAGKKWAFIGDSLARNHLQSLLCYLAQVEVPESAGGDPHWYFRSYNFTLTIAWAPFLVKGTEDAGGLARGIAELHLDVVEKSWAPWLHTFDYIVLSGGHWIIRPALYYVQNKLVGCHDCPIFMKGTPQLGFGYAYSAILRNVFDFLISSKYKGVVFFRTYAPDHWQNGAWDQGGNCTQTAPVDSNTTALDGMNLYMYKLQLEEFDKVVQRSSEYSFTLKLVDTMHSALLRPDAHPGPYGRFLSSVQNDCLHWCLPGALDTWSAMLLHVLKHL